MKINNNFVLLPPITTAKLSGHREVIALGTGHCSQELFFLLQSCKLRFVSPDLHKNVFEGPNEFPKRTKKKSFIICTKLFLVPSTVSY